MLDTNALVAGSCEKSKGPRRKVGMARVSGRHSEELGEVILYHVIQLYFNI